MNGINKSLLSPLLSLIRMTTIFTNYKEVLTVKEKFHRKNNIALVVKMSIRVVNNKKCGT